MKTKVKSTNGKHSNFNVKTFYYFMKTMSFIIILLGFFATFQDMSLNNITVINLFVLFIMAIIFAIVSWILDIMKENYEIK